MCLCFPFVDRHIANAYFLTEDTCDSVGLIKLVIKIDLLKAVFSRNGELRCLGIISYVRHPLSDKRTS